MWFAIVWFACGSSGPSPAETADSGDRAPALDRAVRLRWVRAHPDETFEHAVDGLWWSLSNLGAVPPADAAVTDVDDAGDVVTFSLDLDGAGLSEGALAALDPTLTTLRAADEAEVYGAVDLGRFLMRTVYEPPVYFAVTGACATIDAWRAARPAADPAEYAVTTSLLVGTDRLVRFERSPGDVAAIAFEAVEGEGSLEDGTFVGGESHVVDVMSNGQQRFAVYDPDGALVATADVADSPAGQPGKCVWCHEYTLQIGTAANDSAPGYLDYDAWLDALVGIQAMMTERREQLDTAVAFDHARDVHRYADFLAEAFAEPSVDRLAREWGATTAEVEDAIAAAGLVTFTSAEYPELGPLVRRDQADALWEARHPGRRALPTQRHPREWSATATGLAIEPAALRCAAP